MKKLIDNTDLGIPYTTALNKAVVKVAQSTLGINKINALYDKVADKEGVDFAQAVLDELKVTVKVDDKRLDYIPKTGPFILIANQPYGALDGLLLMTLIGKIRPDVKFLGNFLLSQIEPLRGFFLQIAPFNEDGKQNIVGIRQALRYLKEGAPLVIFPAEEVSTFQKRFGKIEDRVWELPIVKFITNAKVPVIPAYLGGRNSLAFHLLGKIHPLFMTMRLPLELLNKAGETVSVVLGSPVMPARLRSLERTEDARDLLRANVYALKLTLTKGSEEVLPGQVEGKVDGQESASAESTENKESLPDLSDKEAVGRELSGLQESRLFTKLGGMSLFCAPADEIPETLREIVKLRNSVLKHTEELKGKREIAAHKTEDYDSLYWHLVVWDEEAKKIVAASTIGFGDALYDAKGFDGFYTYSLFELSRRLTEVLRQSVELGHSFVLPGYPRRMQALLLLWRGVMQELLHNRAARYLIGPISVSEGHSAAAKWMLINYIQGRYWNREMAKFVIPRNGTGALGRQMLDPELIWGMKALEDMDKLIKDVEPTGQGVPILMKKYLQLGGKVVGFNVERETGGTLDAMLMLDLRDMPRERLERLAKEFGIDPEEVFDRIQSLPEPLPEQKK